MPKKPKIDTADKILPDKLKGWRQIADFLGEPVSVVKRWKSEGMPVAEEGRFVSASPKQLTEWLGRESGKPIELVRPETDLTAELKRGVTFARQQKRNRRQSS